MCLEAHPVPPQTQWSCYRSSKGKSVKATGGGQIQGLLEEGLGESGYSSGCLGARTSLDHNMHRAWRHRGVRRMAVKVRSHSSSSFSVCVSPIFLLFFFPPHSLPFSGQNGSGAAGRAPWPVLVLVPRAPCPPRAWSSGKPRPSIPPGSASGAAG